MTRPNVLSEVFGCIGWGIIGRQMSTVRSTLPELSSNQAKSRKNKYIYRAGERSHCYGENRNHKKIGGSLTLMPEKRK